MSNVVFSSAIDSKFRRGRLLAVAALLTATALVSGCSSAGKSHGGEAPTGSSEAEDAFSGGDSGGQSEAARPVSPKDKLEEPTSKQMSMDSKYKTLAQALRSGNGPATQEEAAKILATNASDPVALNALALVHLRRGRTGAAKLLLGRALEKNAGNASLYNNYGVALLDEGDQIAAIAQFKKALQADDRHTEALGNLGSIYAQAGDFSKARPLLEQSYRQNRGNMAVANNYAMALRASKDYDGARRIYEDILKQNSRDVNALINFAILLIDYMGKPKDGLDLVYKVKFIETDRKDVLTRANALEKKAKSELK